MTAFEAFQIVLELENRAGDQGSYLVTALFAFVMVIYLYGRSMTRLMVAIIWCIYTAFTFLNIAAIYACMRRIVRIQEQWPSVLGQISADTPDVYFATAFWIAVWLASVFFMVLVLQNKIAPTSS